MAGAAPSFTEVHLVRTLLALKRRKTGRKNLVKRLGLGEGSVRTILERLRGEGLISSSKLGQELTSEGEQMVQGYLRRFTLPERFELEEIGLPGEGMEKCLIVVFDSADRIKSGMEQRDAVRSTGAEGVLVLVSKGGMVGFPTPDVKLSDFPGMLKKLSKLDLRGNDTIVISFGETYARAEDGAVAVALNLKLE
jgi:hypothetical protein